MRLLVQKFGGTSVATREARKLLVSRVSDAVRDGYSPVLVVSAMGRFGEPYATDSLIDLARRVYRSTPPREMDMLMSCGEVIASVVVSSTLMSAGLAAVALTGTQAGIMTDSDFGNAGVLQVNPERVQQLVSESRIPVVAGFQGSTADGEITTLGRGGSDTTAALLGAALGAESVEIYTDVDGVKTADPRLVPKAQTIRTLTYDEVSQMANQGAKVLNPRAVGIAMRHNVPIRVRSVFEDAPGTLVTALGTAGIWPEARSGKVVTGVTHIPDLCQVCLSAGSVSHTLVFRALADQGISVDMIAVSRDECSFVIKQELLQDAARVLSELGLEPEVCGDCAKVSVVGSGMRGLPGVMAGVSEALEKAEVEILKTSDSHITISCLVRSEDLMKAARALHTQFGLDAEGQG